jgi:hypothetical protein
MGLGDALGFTENQAPAVSGERGTRFRACACWLLAVMWPVMPVHFCGAPLASLGLAACVACCLTAVPI